MNTNIKKGRASWWHLVMPSGRTVMKLGRHFFFLPVFISVSFLTTHCIGEKYDKLIYKNNY